MEKLILKYFKKQKRKRIKTSSLENYLQQVKGRKEYQKTGGYEKFAQIIKELTQKKKIRPIKAWGRNGLFPELYNGYQLMSSQKLKEDIKQEILTAYHPKINTAYYLKNVKDYQQDKKYLKLLNKFLKENDKLGLMSVNERSFQIFNQEKFLNSSRGRSFLQKISLSFNDLNCYQAYEPFFYFATGKSAGEVKALIVENKDTFVSFKSLFQEGIKTWDNLSFDLLIYGEGKKILNSFSFFSELKQYQLINTRFYYFGDLDPEGIKIWNKLNQNREVEFRPVTFFYQLLMENYQENAPDLHKEQTFNQQAINDFCSCFREKFKQKLNDLFDKNKYIPQEGLNYSLLKKIGKE